MTFFLVHVRDTTVVAVVTPLLHQRSPSKAFYTMQHEAQDKVAKVSQKPLGNLSRALTIGPTYQEVYNGLGLKLYYFT
uniref:Uncharacterized protein n=1 Tax=Vespula pensylvanica TaxID=30213 RepID=A0A834UHI9_VESPE|nr:hypothetical protein H0235_001594 [Vespula pensylvanica]